MLCFECNKEFEKVTSNKYCSKECREKHRLKIQKERYNNNFKIREGYKKRQKRYYNSNKNNKEFINHNNELKRKSNEKLVLEVLTYYSNGTLKCACCGEDIYEFLTIDHINGGGHKHRKQIGMGNLYRWLRKNNFPKGYQVLCFNCNCGKIKNGCICPHKRVVNK